ncbi:glycosyltransferase family 61 protein [Candidatus Pelagibacter sp.]|nr:glycosyltransferase family 61 protein [Candidatus Pelagibacter sp.]
MEKISIILKYLYKSLVRYFFKLLYGKVAYEDTITVDEGITINKINNDDILKLNSKKYHIYKLINGRVYTDFVENVALINKNKILNNVSYQQINGQLKSSQFNSTIYNGTPKFKKKINGKILCLTQGASGHKNYFHWLFDILPKIKLYSEIYDLKSLDYFYLSKLEEFQKKTLEILGLNKIKTLDADIYRHVEAKELFAVEHPWYTQGHILEEAKNLPPWIIHWIRDSFLASAIEFDANEKIFIDRSESKFNHCQFQNNNEIVAFLISKGFSIYKIGQLSFEQQVYLFKKAKVIVGAHGAAFANLVFCSPKTKVIEIKPSIHPNYVSKTISKINALEIKVLEMPTIKKNNNIKGDIFLDINELNRNL